MIIASHDKYGTVKLKVLQTNDWTRASKINSFAKAICVYFLILSPEEAM
jgi:hypothetical protein